MEYGRTLYFAFEIYGPLDDVRAKFSSKWHIVFFVFEKRAKFKIQNCLPIKIMTIKEPTRTIVSVGRCWLSREAPSAWFSTKFSSKWDVELLLLSRLGRRPEPAWCPSRLGTNNWWWLWSSEPPLLSNFSWSFWKKEPKLYTKCYKNSNLSFCT